MTPQELYDQIEKLAALNRGGVLTDDEFTREKARLLGATSAATPAHAPAAPYTPAPQTASKRTWIAVAIGVVVCLLIVIGARTGSDDTVHLRNLQNVGFFSDIFRGQVLNEGPSGDVYVWIEIGGRTYCPRRTYLRNGEAQRFEIRCYGVPLRGERIIGKTRRPPDELRRRATSL